MILNFLFIVHLFSEWFVAQICSLIIHAIICDFVAEI